MKKGKQVHIPHAVSLLNIITHNEKGYTQNSK